MTQEQRDYLALRRDLAALRCDMAEGFGSMHIRFTVLHKTVTRLTDLLGRLEARMTITQRHDAAT